MRVAARIDAVRSMVIPTCGLVLPAGSRPGHRKMAGTRMPPSQAVSLRWNRGAFRDSHSPPLSLVKITSVFRARLRASIAAMIWPTPSSARSSMAAYSFRVGAGTSLGLWNLLLFGDFEYRSGGWNGQWAALYATSRKNGRAAWVWMNATAAR